MKHLTALLAVIGLALLPVACGKGANTRTAGSNTRQGELQSSQPSTRPAGPDWTAMYARVPGKERIGQIVELLKQAQAIKAQADAASGDRKKQLIDEAKEKYQEAGDLYDVLQEDVARIDAKLWEMRFRDLQADWDRYSKGLRRLGY
jgi:hypothetical protein